jgi:hypothetical protein
MDTYCGEFEEIASSARVLWLVDNRTSTWKGAARLPFSSKSMSLLEWLASLCRISGPYERRAPYLFRNFFSAAGSTLSFSLSRIDLLPLGFELPDCGESLVVEVFFFFWGVCAPSLHLHSHAVLLLKVIIFKECSWKSDIAYAVDAVITAPSRSAENQARIVLLQAMRLHPFTSDG